MDARKRKKSKMRSEQRALRKKRDQCLNPEKYGKAKSYKKKRKSDAFWQSNLLAGRGQKIRCQEPEEGELDPKV